MSTVGQIEKKTQQRVVNLFRDTLGYDYLGNRNIEANLLRAFLTGKQGCDDNVITRALHILDKAAGDTSKSLYDRNRSVYELLRYGVKVRPDIGQNMQTVWLVDWAPGEQSIRHRRGSHHSGNQCEGLRQTPRCGALCERHRSRCA
jgi:type I restriction enzyme R subunit